jgi:inosine-uridine nucleoside N-ribohydrolase
MCVLRVVCIFWQVTHTCLVTDEVVKALEAFDSPFGRLMIDLLQFFAQTYKDIFFFDFPPLHDPLTIAYVM